MPVYEFHCESHGTFDALRPMAAFADPCPCPHCGAPAPRVLITPPRLAARDRGQVKAHAVNERSADSPRRASSHGPSCACCGPKKAKGATLTRPNGSKSFPTKRPWMISH
jgi:putative FmdB family regulatory protein